MLKRTVSLLLGLLLLLSALSAYAAGMEQAAYASIEELPYLVQGRPDLSPPEPLAVTVTEKTILYAPASGKNEYKELLLVGRDNMGLLEKLKWNSKQKAYVFDFVKKKFDISKLDDLMVVYQKSLKKDAKISKQMASRFLEYRFSAVSGSFETSYYAVNIKTKEETQHHSLSRDVKGFYRHQENGRYSLFDQAGLRIPTPAVPVPENPVDIQGLPDMTMAAFGYHFPENPQEGLAVKADGTWDEVVLEIVGFGSYRKNLAYDEAAQLWKAGPTAAWDDNEAYQQAIHIVTNVGQGGMRFHLVRQAQTGEEFNASIVFDVMSLAWNTRSPYDAFDNQPDLHADSNIQYQRINEYGIIDLIAMRIQDTLRVVFYDMAGNELADKTYQNMPALELPQPISIDAAR